MGRILWFCAAIWPDTGSGLSLLHGVFGRLAFRADIAADGGEVHVERLGGPLIALDAGGMAQPVEVFGDVAQNFGKQPAVAVIFVDRLAPVAPRVDRARRTGTFDLERSRHAPGLSCGMLQC